MTDIPVTTRRNLQRRSFVKLCATTVAAVSAAPGVLAQTGGSALKLYQRVRLTKAGGAPLRASELTAGESYVFNYPFVTTPCFLLDLGRPLEAAARLQTESGDAYVWPGGVGARKSLVAFSAICAHKMTHPAKSVSFINYRHEAVSFRDSSEQVVKRDGVILCCSEKSVYDPAQGGQVLGGPAKQPLCSIVLEHDEADDSIYALGSNGGEMFEQFFERFAPRLQLEWGISDVQATVRDTTPVVSMEKYSRTQMLCGG